MALDENLLVQTGVLDHQREADRGVGLEQHLFNRQPLARQNGRSHRHRRQSSGKLFRRMDLRRSGCQRRPVKLGDRAEAVAGGADATLDQRSRHPTGGETLSTGRDADVARNVSVERRSRRPRGAAGVCRQQAAAAAAGRLQLCALPLQGQRRVGRQRERVAVRVRQRDDGDAAQICRHEHLFRLLHASGERQTFAQLHLESGNFSRSS